MKVEGSLVRVQLFADGTINLRKRREVGIKHERVDNVKKAFGQKRVSVADRVEIWKMMRVEKSREVKRREG